MATKQIHAGLGLLLGLSLTLSAVPAVALTIGPLIHYPDPEYNPNPDPEAPWFTVTAGNASVFHGYRTNLNGALTYNHETAVPGVYKIGFRWFQLEGRADSEIALYIDGALRVKVNSQDAPQGKNRDQASHYAEYVLSADTHEIKLVGTHHPTSGSGYDAYLHTFEIELVKELSPLQVKAELDAAGKEAKANLDAARAARIAVDNAMAKVSRKSVPAAMREISQDVEAGIVNGFPYLRNKRVIYLWAKGKSGGGLLRIRDLISGKELLAVDEAEAASWKVDLKGKGQLSYENAGEPLKVQFNASAGEGKLSFTWALREVRVEVETRLRSAESLARSRITVRAESEGAGLKTVTFPVVKGILPFTEGAKGDEILQTDSIGRMTESPLISGMASQVAYPGASMQFTTLMGDGRGFYFAEEDGQANRKHFAWTPDAERGTLTFSISHPVLNWGAKELVNEYGRPGDVVMGPFQGDWFDAARIYREWALTAPWSRKGPISEREDFPRWLARLGYWMNAPLKHETEIDLPIMTQEFFDLPDTICKDFGFSMGAYSHHDLNPEYLPPRLGSVAFARVVKELRAKGIRVVPYVNGYLWNQGTESYRMEDAERRAGLLMESGIVPNTWVGSPDLSAAMCPATDLWRQKLGDLTKELVGKYGISGVYIDYLTNHNSDCFNKEHGHAIAGGNYWSRSVHSLYEHIRRGCKELDPEAILCGEMAAEWCIDVLDTMHSGSVSSNAPVYLAVYHGYTQIFGGVQNCTTPQTIGRWWLMGTQNGENNVMPWLAIGVFGKKGPYYRDLLRCHAEFARPYLGYGEMLRPPKIEGDLPILPGSPCAQYEPAFPVKAVEGSAWRASDGTVGLFFLNYDTREHEFTWTTDLNEFAGLGKTRKLKVTGWSEGKGEETIGVWAGGVVKKTMTIGPWGLIALKLEVTQ